MAQLAAASRRPPHGAPGAVLDGQGVNRAAFTQLAKDVVIDGLTIQNFVAPQDQGVVNHDSGDGWVIQDNTIEKNGGAGMMAGSRQRIIGNCLRDNRVPWSPAGSASRARAPIA